MWCDFMPAIGGQLAVTADNYLDGDGSQWRLKIIFFNYWKLYGQNSL